MSYRDNMTAEQLEADDRGLAATVGVIAGFAMTDWDLSPQEEYLALRSPAFRELMNQRHLHPGYDDLLSLTAIWEKAGSPEDKRPTVDQVSVSDDGAFEDRGPEGVFGDYEAAAWYTQTLDDQIDMSMIADMFY